VLHLDVVELEDIDVIRLQPFETLVDREPHEIAIEFLGELVLPAAR